MIGAECELRLLILEDCDLYLGVLVSVFQGGPGEAALGLGQILFKPLAGIPKLRCVQLGLGVGDGFLQGGILRTLLRAFISQRGEVGQRRSEVEVVGLYISPWPGIVVPHHPEHRQQPEQGRDGEPDVDTAHVPEGVGRYGHGESVPALWP